MSALLLKHWKAMLSLVVIALLLVVLGYYKLAYNSYKGKFESAQIELRQNKEKFQTLAKQSDDLMDRLHTAQKQVETIQSNTKVKVIREQVVPKECTAAIEFAIEHVEDLQW